MDSTSNAGLAKAQEAPIGIELDLGNLTAFDTRIYEGDEFEKATEAVQSLVTAIFSLPAVSTEDGKLVKLPPPSFSLPREKPIPKERPLTKWEKFAKEKGIQKKKRDRLVLDEATGEYVPRYGRGSKNSLQKDVIIPHKEGMGDNYDPFAEKRNSKKLRVKDNKKKQAVNIRTAQKSRGSQISPIQALDVAKTGPSGKKFLPKKGLKDALAVVQKSTASAGKFDKRVPKEPKQKSRGVKRKFESVVSKSGIVQEKERTQKIAERVLLQNR
ncbi:ribosome biogenesis regulatory protein [Gracilaria domingensis]|nr:ribosome biogenesis regulatory protein [Gracilaria domingensis]